MGWRSSWPVTTELLTSRRQTAPAIVPVATATSGEHMSFRQRVFEGRGGEERGGGRAGKV